MIQFKNISKEVVKVRLVQGDEKVQVQPDEVISVDDRQAILLYSNKGVFAKVEEETKVEKTKKSK